MVQIAQDFKQSRRRYWGSICSVSSLSTEHTPRFILWSSLHWRLSCWTSYGFI